MIDRNLPYRFLRGLDSHFKILAFQNLQFKLFAHFKILAFQKNEFKIWTELNILAEI